MCNDIRLVLAKASDAELIHQMKYKAFLPLYEKYQDEETSPVKEPLEKVIMHLQDEHTHYYLIKKGSAFAGAVRVVERKPEILDISPIFILPEYQDQGIGSAVMEKLFSMHPEAVSWRLFTILQESRDCHFYEKHGFYQNGKIRKVNENLSTVGYEKANVTVRRIQKTDAEEVVNMVVRNFREVNIKDYGQEAIEEMIKTHDVQWIWHVAETAHMYVICRGKKIVATGAIAPYWGSETESILLTIFVLPEYHGKGIGRALIRTLEQDEFFYRAKRVEIPASITGVEFYRKFGYDYKNGVKELDEEGLYRLEKFTCFFGNIILY